jgi:hypothetical protein
MTSPNAYRELQNTSLFSYAGESTVKCRKSEQSADDGKNVSMYLLQALTYHEKSREPNRIRTGHIACDEFKIKGGLVFNTKSHKICKQYQ